MYLMRLTHYYKMKPWWIAHWFVKIPRLGHTKWYYRLVGKCLMIFHIIHGNSEVKKKGGCIVPNNPLDFNSIWSCTVHRQVQVIKTH